MAELGRRGDRWSQKPVPHRYDRLKADRFIDDHRNHEIIGSDGNGLRVPRHDGFGGPARDLVAGSPYKIEELPYWTGGGIGIRAGLRSQFLTDCGFESRPVQHGNYLLIPPGPL